MKKIFQTIITALATICMAYSLHAQIKPTSDECIELVGIVFRLTGAPEYNGNSVPEYIADINSYFNPFKQHSVIILASKLYKSGIQYDAVMSFAGALKINNGKISIDNTSLLDGRWKKHYVNNFLKELNDFYKKTNFNAFYSRHKSIYDNAVIEVNSIIEKIDFNWFKKFYAKNIDSINIIVSPNNAFANYSVDFLHGKPGIIIGCGSDDLGYPKLNPTMQYILVHEITHIYVSQILKIHNQFIIEPINNILKQVGEITSEFGYITPNSIAAEWMSALFSLMYFQENCNPDINITNIIEKYEDMGFIWMSRSVEYMRHCHKNIYDFLPHLYEFLSFTAQNITSVELEYELKHPYIKEIYQENIQGTIILNFMFSEPMSECSGIDVINETIPILPYTWQPYWKDCYTFIVRIPQISIRTGKTYGIKLLSEAFESDEGYKMKNDYDYTLKF